jgi:prolyl-tRNA synthetase
MKYRDLQIQTQREAPNNARTQGFAFLVRAGYLTRDYLLTKLGEQAINHLRGVSSEALRSLPTIGNENQTFFPSPAGDIEVAHCSSCNYTEWLAIARFNKTMLPHEEPRPMEKVSTPNCNTIESLANFLGIAKEKTAKALMYTRVTDGKFVFVVVRGDTQLSEIKLKRHVRDIRLATTDEIVSAGGAAGYASAIGLKDALIVVDDLIPQSQNLVAGANETGYHLKNTNYSRDYSAEIVADLIQAKEGDPCIQCGNLLSVLPAIVLTNDYVNILLALAESYHDDKGLTFPHPTSPFDVYLMHIAGKEIDTRAKAEEIYSSLQSAGVSALFDDRDERAGVKFNDADLIGCPIRVTVGEKALKEGKTELKQRTGKENLLIPIENLTQQIQFLLH